MEFVFVVLIHILTADLICSERSLSLDEYLYDDLHRVRVDSDDNVNYRPNVDEDSSIEARDDALTLPEVWCKPLPKIFRTYSTYQYHPFYAELYRCEGAVPNKLTTQHRYQCVPVADKIVSIDVKLEPVASWNTKSIEVKLYNHTACIVGCRSSQSSCGVHEKFNKANCICECAHPIIDIPEKYWHLTQYCDWTKKTFDIHACQCRCSYPSRCSHPLIWKEDVCKCGCKDTSPCPQGSDRDAHTCRCVPRQSTSQLAAELLTHQILAGLAADSSADNSADNSIKAVETDVQTEGQRTN